MSKAMGYFIRIFAAIALLVSTVFAAGLKLPAFAEDTQIPLDQVESLTIIPQFRDNYYADILDFSVNDSVKLGFSLDLTQPAAAGSKLVYDLPRYFADSEPVPLQDNSSLHLGQVGTCSIKDNKLIFAFSQSGSRYSQCELPTQFSDAFKALANEAGVAKLNVPFALPKSIIIDGRGKHYPDQGSYPADLELPSMTTNNTPLPNPAIFNFSVWSQNVSYDRVKMYAVLKTASGGVPNEQSVIPSTITDFVLDINEISQSGRFTTQGISAGSVLSYAIPEGFAYTGAPELALRTTKGEVVGVCKIADNVIKMQFNTFVDISKKLTCDPIRLTYSNKVKELLYVNNAQNLVIPFGFPHANVNYIPLQLAPDGSGKAYLGLTPADLKLPSIAVNSELTGDQTILPLHIDNVDNLDHKLIDLKIKATRMGSNSLIGATKPIEEGDNFDLNLNIHSTVHSLNEQGQHVFWGNLPQGAGTFRYKLPNTTLLAPGQSASVDLIDKTTRQKCGTCSVEGNLLVVKIDRTNPRSDSIVSASALRFAYQSEYNNYFTKPFVRMVNIPFAIPGVTINGITSPQAGQGPQAFELPMATVNTTPVQNEDQYFVIPVLKKNKLKDSLQHVGDDTNPGPVDPSEEDRSNLISSTDLITDFNFSFNGVPISQNPHYEEQDQLSFSGTFKSKPGVVYKGKKVIYELPSDYVKFTSPIRNQKIIDHETQQEIGTITIHANRIVINFSTDFEFTGRIDTTVNFFNLYEISDRGSTGQDINVPFTLTGAVVESKQQPLETTLPDPTLGNEPLNLPDPNIVVLHPKRAFHNLGATVDGKEDGVYVSDNEVHWGAGASPLFAGDESSNSFVIAYDLPWDGMQIRTDSQAKLVIKQKSGLDYIGLALNMEDFKDHALVFKKLNNAVISIKRVWFHTDATGQPITELQHMPVMSPGGDFIPNKFTSHPVLVPKDAVETDLTDPNPPEGFSAKSPCGIVIRAVNLPWNSVFFQYETKIVDLTKAQAIDEKKQLIFNNRWSYGQEVYLKENPYSTMGFAPFKSFYDAQVVRTTGKATGELVFHGKLSVKKVAKTTGNPLSGGRFALLNASGEPAFDEQGRLLNNLVANEQGELCYVDRDRGGALVPLSQLSLLQGEDFAIQELEAPEGYLLPDNPITKIALISGKDNGQITIENELATEPLRTGVSLPDGLEAWMLVLAVLTLIGLGSVMFIHQRGRV